MVDPYLIIMLKKILHFNEWLCRLATMGIGNSHFSLERGYNYNRGQSGNQAGNNVPSKDQKVL